MALTDLVGESLTTLGATAATIAPYLPRLVIEWIADSPASTHGEVDGTLAFIDISGFTQLSERLARRGKVGAEELAGTIDVCFESLLEVAYGYGANLLKFGGDALLLLFTDEHHEVRGSQATVAMRRKLREVGRLEVGGHRVSLRMSAGLHSGPLNLFLVGDSHRELLLTGSGASTAVLMEASASAGEILVSEDTAGALPPSCLGVARGGGRLLKSSPSSAPPGRPAVVSVPDGVDLSACVPTALRSLIVTGGHEAEHRRVTVAFLHYDGTDELIARAGAQEAARHLDQLVRCVQAAADRWAITFLGTDIDRDGGKIILAAGAPSSSGDDERSMLLALREIVESDLPIALRIGVNHGAVFVGDIGPAYRRTFTVMGDAVNLAARLMAKAEPGKILATEPVLAASRTDFDTVALEPFMVKGKARPVHARSVGPIKGARVAAASSVPLIGRDTELEILLGAAGRACAGSGEIVELVGEPGIGKSRLLDELRARSPEMAQLRVSCEPYESSTPYFVWAGVIEPLLGIEAQMTRDERGRRLDEVLEARAGGLRPWAPLLSAVLDLPMVDTEETAPLEGPFRRARLGRLIVELLGALLPTPTLLTIEDSHWMDEGSADVLEHVAAELDDHPWLICVTSRGRDIAVVPASTQSLHLQPLDRDAALDLLHAASEASPMPVHQIATLVDRSGGNPLFLHELIDLARSSDGVDGLPGSVEALIVARLDRLEPHLRTLVRHMSVLGRTSSLALAAEVVGREQLDDEVLWSRLAGVLHLDGDDVVFDHALIRDGAYEGLSYRLRRELHGRAGDAIRASSTDDGEHEAELLSLHYLNAGRYDEAWRFSRVAADWAVEVNIHVEAAEFCVRALDAARHLPDLPTGDVAATHEQLGDARHAVGNYAGAETAYKAARRLTKGEAVTDARLMLKLSWQHGWTDNYSLALRWISLGLRRLDGAEGDAAARQRAQLRAWYGRFCQEQGRHARAIKWCQLAIDDATAAGDKESLAHALRILGWADQDLGRLDRTTYLDQALALYQEIGDLPGQASVLNMLGGQAYFTGRWTTALELYERARDILGRAGNTATQAFETTNIGEILLDQGHVDDAKRAFTESLRIWTAAGHRSGVAYAQCNLARSLAREGRYADALPLFEESRAGSHAVGAQADALETTARLAECLAAMGDAPGALAVADEALAQAHSFGGVAPQSPLLHRVRGVAFLRLGQLDEAEAALDESLQAGRSRQAEFEVALTLHAQAGLVSVTGRGDREELLAESQELLDRLGVISVPEVAG